MFVGVSVVSAFEYNLIYEPKLLNYSNWLYVGGSGEGNYSKIQDAIDNAATGDIIYVYLGVYKENILINKSLTVIGEEKNITIIDGSENNYVIQIFANDTRISNFTIQNCSKNGINIECSGCIIDNNIIQNCSYLGISMRNSTHAIISNNIIRYNERGLCLCLFCFDTTILSNKIEKNNYCGLYFYQSCNNYVLKNNFEKNKCGMIISISHNNTFKLNNICSCKICNLNLYKSSNNSIINNNFLKSIVCAFFNCCNNHWESNYWNKPRILPKPIFGIIELIRFNLKVPWVCYDWSPAQKIYEIVI
jgi:parallel beta-helix repeat protein